MILWLESTLSDARHFFNGGYLSVKLTRRDESPELRAESQQIAAWQLLYRVQHPARYQSRLQTIPSPDIELPEGLTQVKPRPVRTRT
jgi:hypothetical protein